jgi:hypothetical protein
MDWLAMLQHKRRLCPNGPRCVQAKPFAALHAEADVMGLSLQAVLFVVLSKQAGWYTHTTPSPKSHWQSQVGLGFRSLLPSTP